MSVILNGVCIMKFHKAHAWKAIRTQLLCDNYLGIEVYSTHLTDSQCNQKTFTKPREKVETSLASTTQFEIRARKTDVACHFTC